MKPTPEQLARALAASYSLRDKGDPSKNLKPVSFTASPSAHVDAIAEAVLQDAPESKRCEACDGTGDLHRTDGEYLGRCPFCRPITLTEQLQTKCSEWGTYWRAPDAQGVVLTMEQALELLRDALGVEVVIGSTGEADASPGWDFGCECGFGCPPGDGCRHP